MTKKEQAKRRARIRRGLKHEINVTVPLETITGDADHPGYLARYGPITAALARTMALDAAAEGYWRCVVTDTTHGTLLGMGRSTYTPAYQAPLNLQRYLNLRDRHCDFPGCRQPAVTCEFDHHIPYPAGATCECNGRKRCPHHHRIKHHTAWQVEDSTNPAHPPGTTIWTTPTGSKHATLPPVIGLPTHQQPHPTRPNSTTHDTPGPRTPKPGTGTRGTPEPGTRQPGTRGSAAGEAGRAPRPASNSDRRPYRDVWRMPPSELPDLNPEDDPNPPPF